MADVGKEEVCRKFRNTGKCRYEDKCKFVHSAGEPLDNPPPKECFNFRDNGTCRFGNKCRFLHPASDDQQVNGGNSENKENMDQVQPRRRRNKKRNKQKPGLCFAFKDNKDCQYGENCRFRHGEDDTRDFGIIMEAIKKQRGVCYDFQKTGTCNFNARCRFSHDMEQTQQADVAAN